MEWKPRLVKRKGVWTVANPMGEDAKYVRNFVANRWVQAYYFCNLLNFR
ncbi:hypothetical protein VP464E531_P0050 [Vibrio phage 464E53-1]|nr:hypothetical protein VP464E531_P0050 [Vibrio phage 464E53-1]